VRDVSARLCCTRSYITTCHSLQMMMVTLLSCKAPASRPSDGRRGSTGSFPAPFKEGAVERGWFTLPIEIFPFSPAAASGAILAYPPAQTVPHALQLPTFYVLGNHCGHARRSPHGVACEMQVGTASTACCRFRPSLSGFRLHRHQPGSLGLQCTRSRRQTIAAHSLRPVPSTPHAALAAKPVDRRTLLMAAAAIMAAVSLAAPMPAASHATGSCAGNFETLISAGHRRRRPSG